MDGGIWMPCPQTIGGLPCPPGLVSTLESCVAAPNGGMNDLTIAGSPRGSSATGAEVNASVSHPFVEVRSTLGLPAILLITGTGTSVGSVSASKVDQQEDGPRLPHVGRNQRLPRVTLPRAAQQVACEKSKAPPLPRGPFNNHCLSCQSASSFVRRDSRSRGPNSVQCLQVWPKIPNDRHELLSRGSFNGW